MAIIQPIKDGKVVEDTSKKSNKQDKTQQADKEMFLKLLVAEMQYQDPLQPTSNTDYVKELATFSQVEAVQGVQDKVNNLSGNSLVGKYVILYTKGASGEKEYISGKVDYVTTDEKGDIYLSVNEKQYSLDDLDSVCDENYYTAVTGAQDFHSAVDRLPNPYALTLKDEEKVTLCRKVFDAMNNYQKQYVYADDVKKLEALEERLAALKKAAEAAEGEKSDESN